ELGRLEHAERGVEGAEVERQPVDVVTADAQERRPGVERFEHTDRGRDPAGELVERQGYLDPGPVAIRRGGDRGGDERRRVGRVTDVDAVTGRPGGGDPVEA